MSSPNQDRGTPPRAASQTEAAVSGASPAGRNMPPQQPAATGPVPETVSAAEDPVEAGPSDSPAEAQGRRTLSTAFVRVGPDGRLTVELRDGRALVLRNVAMHARSYCGEQVSAGAGGARYCGKYGDVAAARPGGPPPPAEPDLAAPNPIESRGKLRKGD